MKNITQYFLLSTLLLLTTVTVSANNRYGSYEGQGRWSSTSISPQVEIYLKNNAIYAKSLGQTMGVPATKLKTINSNLLNEYTEQFVLVEDFNHDSFNDIAILSRALSKSHQLCYAVFEYQPDFYLYRSKPSNTLCLNK